MHVTSKSMTDAQGPRRSGSQRFVSALGLLMSGVSLAVSAASCCFGGSYALTPPSITVSDPNLDPSVGVLRICATLESGPCAAHSDTLPSNVPSLYYSLRTRELERFRTPATIVYIVGNERVELGPTPAMTLPPGHTGTWNIYQRFDAPPEGWPVSAPMRLELIDSTGVVVTTSQVTFVGPQTPTVPVNVLQICRTDQLVTATSARCSTTSTVVIRDLAQDLYASYATIDRAACARGFVFVIERQEGQRWVELESVRTTPTELTPDHMYTAHISFSMGQSDLVSDPLRVRLLSGDAELSSATFTIQSP